MDTEREQRHSRHMPVGTIIEYVMTGLAFVFLVLVIVQYTVDLSAMDQRRLNLVLTLIWAVFGIDFFVRLALAPSKGAFLQRNWIAGVALLLPALRVLRIFSIARAAPPVQLSGIVSGGKRGTDWLHRVVGLHPALYIGLLTLFIMALSSAGMFSIEHTRADANILTVGDGIWWTTATLTTIGSELYPVSWEGRALAIFIMIYSVGFAGYVAGTFAAILLGTAQNASAGSPPDTEALREEIRALRHQLQAAGRTPTPSEPEPAANATDAAQPPALTTPHSG
jgi:voltage-gated potassium channel